MSIDQSINLLQNIKLYNFVAGGQRPPGMVKWTFVLSVVLLVLLINVSSKTVKLFFSLTAFNHLPSQL